MDKEEHILPPSWLREFLDRADLTHSFEALKGCTHFHAETMRGRIRSLELRGTEAWKHFDRALAKAAGTVETIPNLIREMILNLYCFEQKLLEGPLRTDLKPPELWIPEFPKEVL